jgi:hypothetical protein
MAEAVDPQHLLLIGAAPGVGAGVVRRFGREGFRSTLISPTETLGQLAPELRNGGLEIEAIDAPGTRRDHPETGGAGVSAGHQLLTHPRAISEPPG